MLAAPDLVPPPGHDDFLSCGDALHRSVVTTLQTWTAPTADQDDLREAFLGLLAARPDACSRHCVPGHITASAVLFDADASHVALVLHKIIQVWVVPGGHLEASDRSAVAAATREIREETGVVTLLDPQPVELSCHRFTCRNSPPTRHYDLCFTGQAPQDASLTVSEESRDLQWWPVKQLPEPLAGRMPGTISRALERYR